MAAAAEGRKAGEPVDGWKIAVGFVAAFFGLLLLAAVALLAVRWHRRRRAAAGGAGQLPGSQSPKPGTSLDGAVGSQMAQPFVQMSSHAI